MEISESIQGDLYPVAEAIAKFIAAETRKNSLALLCGRLKIIDYKKGQGSSALLQIQSITFR